MRFCNSRSALVLGLYLIIALGAGEHRPADAQLLTIAEITQKLKINYKQRKQFSAAINNIAKKHRLDPALLHAVISVESAFDPNAVSPAGAMGLMQLMPGTATRFGVTNPFDPIANINAGARYLRILLNKFGTIQLALAAYNAGEGRVKQYRNTIPPIMETRKYVVSVIHFYMRYRASQ